jgi:hypothetical protein
MRNWKSAFVTLLLPPTATSDEIRSREKTIADSNSDASLIARNAREALTQNVGAILSSFLSAVPGLSSLEGDLKMMRRKNRARRDLNDEVLADAFEQMGLKFVQQEVTTADIDRSVILELGASVGIKNHYGELQRATESENSSTTENAFDVSNGSPLPPPPLILEG